MEKKEKEALEALKDIRVGKEVKLAKLDEKTQEFLENDVNAFHASRGSDELNFHPKAVTGTTDDDKITLTGIGNEQKFYKLYNYLSEREQEKKTNLFYTIMLTFTFMTLAVSLLKAMYQDLPPVLNFSVYGGLFICLIAVSGWTIWQENV